MKIVITSDMHFGNTADIESTSVPREPCDKIEHERFAAEIHAHKPDVLIVAGDCAETCLWADHLSGFFKTYKNPHGVSIAIPGNHDCWLSRPVRQSHEEKFQDFFVQAKQNGWIGLKDEPWNNIQFDDIAEEEAVWIAGGMGWYDFSSADPAAYPAPMTAREIDDQTFLTNGWSDFPWMKMRSALAVNKMRMAEFEACLNKVPPPDKRKALIVISHFVGMSRLLAKYGEKDWGAAFMGNWEIGKLVAKAEANYYFCGHSHRRMEFELGNTKCVNIGSGYGLGSKRYDVIEI